VDFKNIPQMKKSLQTRSYGVDDKSMEEGNEDVIAADGGGGGGWIVRGYGSNEIFIICLPTYSVDIIRYDDGIKINHS